MDGARLERLAVALIYAAAITSPAASARAADPSAPAPDYSAYARVPIALIVVTPSGKIANSNLSTIYRLADSVLSRSTDLKVSELEDPACKGNYLCYVEAVRKSPPPLPSYLLVIAANRLPDGTADELVSILIDAEAASAHVQAAEDRGASGEDARAELADDILGKFALARSKATVSRDEEVAVFFERLFSRDFRSELEKSEHWQPFGTLVLDVAQPDLEIEIDNVKIAGLTKPGRTVIANVQAGDRTVKLTHPDFNDETRVVNVQKEQVAHLALTVTKKPDTLARGARTGVFWGGIALAAAGTLLTVLAIHQASSHESASFCLRTPNGPECASSPQFIAVGAAGISDELAPDDDINARKSIPYAPLGYSMIGAGAAWSLGTAFFGEDDSLPFIQVGVGIAVFFSSLLLSMALDGKNGVACRTQGGCDEPGMPMPMPMGR